VPNNAPQSETYPKSTTKKRNKKQQEKSKKKKRKLKPPSEKLKREIKNGTASREI